MIAPHRLLRSCRAALFAWLLLLISAQGVFASEPAVTSGDISFELDILPILTSRGCSSGACHGKSGGQNGFQLSLFCFDPNWDYAALTTQSRGRRVFPAAPERSLLLQKASAQLPHGGGVRVVANDADYQLLLRWIGSGMPRSIEGESSLLRVTVTPSELRMQPHQREALRITAHYSDGSQRDVTGRSMFQSNESALVSIDKMGRFTAGPLAGEATLMARYMSQIATCHVLIPLDTDVPTASYDQFVRQLLTARGSTWHNGATTMYRDRRQPEELATMISQLFLGVRLECARCHHHPSERWNQRNFYALAAYFARVKHKGTGVSSPISGGGRGDCDCA